MSFLKGLIKNAEQFANKAKESATQLANEAKVRAEQLAKETKIAIATTFIDGLTAYGFTDEEKKTIKSTIENCTLSMVKIKNALDSLKGMNTADINKKTFMDKLNILCPKNIKGGHYYKKYLKYKHKYLNLKAQLNL
jgi:DNA-directed RNA polymerase specialized sigma54-like protein